MIYTSSDKVISGMFGLLGQIAGFLLFLWAVFMVFFFPAMQLQYQVAGIDEAFVVRPAMCAFTVEQPLIPPAAGFDISHANQRLRSHHLASP